MSTESHSNCESVEVTENNQHKVNVVTTADLTTDHEPLHMANGAYIRKARERG